DAAAALSKGSVEAWSIFHPHLALAELKDKAEVIAFDKDIHQLNSFYIAGSKFVEKHPLIVAELNRLFASEGVWAADHREEVAKAQADATGVDLEAIGRFVNRSNYRVVTIDAEIIASQQVIADRYARIGLIPKPVKVSDIVWKWTPPS
ncbi:MAG: sulfonate ABC transporter substrate-binding protein, partial [Bradyrhizobium sp.]|nr:sulfonate ABC transporter substrate-binding protein [Bradyrhizobium sp.]